jgi:hypothetical protein
MKVRLWPVLLLLPVALAACKSAPAVNPESRNTFLTSNDLQVMTDQMARKLAGDPRVAALTMNGPITIVLKEVSNETNEIIPEDAKWVFINRVSLLLAREPELASRFRFVLNRKYYNALAAKEGLRRELAPPEDDGRLKPDYVLTGTFTAITDSNKKSRSDYYLCTFELFRISPTGGKAGEIIWQDGYETRKAIKNGFLD